MRRIARHFKNVFGSKAATVAFAIFTMATIFSIFFVTRATTPNPGHPWTDIGNGLWQAANTQTQLRTFTFPDNDAEVLTSSSSVTFLQRYASTNVTLSASTDTIVYVDASSSPVTVTLPTATGTNIGLTYVIKKIDSAATGTVTVQPSSGQTIDNISNISLVNRGEGVMIQSDGNQWRIDMRRDYDLDGFHARGTTLNQWYTSPNAGTALTTGALTANRLYAIPFILTKISTIDEIAMDVTNSSGTVGEAGIYNDNGNEYPGALAVDAGSVSSGSNGVKTYTTNLPVTLDAGLYWLVYDTNGAPTVRAFAVASLIPILGYASTLPTNAQFGWFVSQTAGALPGSYPAGGSTITGTPIPAIFARFSG